MNLAQSIVRLVGYLTRNVKLVIKQYRPLAFLQMLALLYTGNKYVLVFAHRAHKCHPGNIDQSPPHTTIKISEPQLEMQNQ